MTDAPANSHAASAEEVLALLAQLCHPLDAARVPLEEASGRILREPVCAREDQPPFDRSSVDGYAVRLGDPASRFRVVDEIRAGEWKLRRLQPGEAARIATGGALPGQDLQVVMREDARREGEFAVVLRRDTERNIRFRGEDARAGEALVPAGTVLQPGALALLASVGCVQPLVTRLPRVLHVATGNEIVPPGQTPGRGQIRDSNSTLVREFLLGWGIVPEQRRVAEDAESVASGLRHPASPPLTCSSSPGAPAWGSMTSPGGFWKRWASELMTARPPPDRASRSSWLTVTPRWLSVCRAIRWRTSCASIFSSAPPCAS